MSKVNLKEYIYPNMDILFVGINAPTKSNNHGHWFSGNLSFWNLLYKANLIKEKITLPTEGDEKIFGMSKYNYQNKIYGVTDLNRDLVQTDSSGVKLNKQQVDRILSIIENNTVKKVCLVHNEVAKEFEKRGMIKRKTGILDGYGIVGKYKGVPIYEVPFHNASISEKEKYYGLLIL